MRGTAYLPPLRSTKTFSDAPGRILIGSLVICNAIFLMLFAVLWYFNRLAIDDYYFLALSRSHDAISATLTEHGQWSGRWASVFLVQVVLFFHDHALNMFFYGMAIMAVFILALYRITLHLMTLMNLPAINRWLALNVAVFIASAFFHASIGIGETWFWLCASATYWVGMVMFLFGVSAILVPRSGVRELVLCAFAFIYVGGSSEPLAVFVLLLLAIAISLNVVKKVFPVERLVIAFAACLVAFIIMYIAPGNRVREQFFEEIGLLRAAVLNVKTTGMIIIQKLPGILPFVLLFSIPAFAIARSSLVTALPGPIVIRRSIIMSAVFFTAIYIYQFPVTYATQDIAADRALFPVTLLALITGVMVLYTLGRAGLGSVRQARVIAVSAVWGIILINAYTLTDQLNVLPEYARAHDQRIEFLESRRDNTGIILVDPLPPAGLLLSAEISTDPGFFSNRHLKAGLGLKADVTRRSALPE